MATLRGNEIQSHLKEIQSKISEMNDHIHNIDITLAKNTLSLDNHIRRTDEVQETNKLLKEQIDRNKEDLEERIEVLEAEKIERRGMSKLLKTLVWIGGAIVTASSVIAILKQFFL